MGPVQGVNAITSPISNLSYGFINAYRKLNAEVGLGKATTDHTVDPVAACGNYRQMHEPRRPDRGDWTL